MLSQMANAAAELGGSTAAGPSRRARNTTHHRPRPATHCLPAAAPRLVHRHEQEGAQAGLRHCAAERRRRHDCLRRLLRPGAGGLHLLLRLLLHLLCCTCFLGVLARRSHPRQPAEQLELSGDPGSMGGLKGRPHRPQAAHAWPGAIRAPAVAACARPASLLPAPPAQPPTELLLGRVVVRCCRSRPRCWWRAWAPWVPTPPTARRCC